MKRNKYIKIPFTLGVMILSMAMFGDNSQTSLESMGFSRAKINETALVELAVDQLRTSIKTGNMAQLKAIISGDLQKSVSKGENAQLSLNSGKENVIFDSINSHLLPKIKLRTTRIALQDKRAVVYGNIEVGSESTTTTELTFAKENDMWKLVSDNELLTNLEAELRNATPEDDTEQSVIELYADDGAENRTIALRAMSDEHSIQKLTKSVTQNKLNRNLFKNPYAGVLFSSVTQSDHAPFFTAQYVQLVTDPAWNRVVYGDYEGWVKAYRNGNSEIEALKSPHGIDRDADGNIYIADTGNNRIVVLKLVGSEGETELNYQFSFGKDNLSLPYDVAWDDAGTPLRNSDDIIWVTDTGNHRILGYSLNEKSAEQKFSYGSNGNAEDEFFEPTSIAVGKFNGAGNGQLYVGDAGNRRVAHLSVNTNNMQWLGSFANKEESQFTAVEVDHWGNVFVTDRSYREIIKLTPTLEPLTTIKGEANALVDPANIHVIFGKVTIESENKTYWSGYDQAFSLEKWAENSGAERYHLGTDFANYNLALSEDLAHLYVNGTLTDNSEVSVAIVDAATNSTVKQISMGWLIAGDKQVSWNRTDDLGLQVKPGQYKLQLTAESGYGGKILKESSNFYLPLYYNEDSGADKKQDAHLVQGTANSEWGTAPFETIAKHPSEVIYRFTDLNPAIEYEFKADFFNKVGYDLKQSIHVNQTQVVQEAEIPAGFKSVNWTALPRETFSDGTVEIRFRKEAGEGDAMVSQLWLRESDFNAENTPDQKTISASIPKEYTLRQNYPNPFNPTTNIEFGVPEGIVNNVTLRIYNTLGQTVAVLMNGQLPPGRHTIVWNGRDNLDRQVSSGVYFYQFKAGKHSEVKKMILMK